MDLYPIPSVKDSYLLELLFRTMYSEVLNCTSIAVAL